jgi:hypothetical protein
MSKIEMKRLYLINKLDTQLSLKGGYITVKRGGYATITEADLDHPDVVDATTKEWAEVWNKEPGASDLPATALPIQINDPYQGMTLAELKASEAVKEPVVESTVESTAEAEPAGKPPAKKEKKATEIKE